MARKVGRPTTYKPEYIDALLKYFDIEPHFETPVVTTYKDGTTKEEVKFIPSDLPTLAGFARLLKVNRATLSDWAEANPEFSSAIKRAKDCQEHILITNAIRGLYNPAFSIMTSKNIGELAH